MAAAVVVPRTNTFGGGMRFIITSSANALISRRIWRSSYRCCPLARSPSPALTGISVRSCSWRRWCSSSSVIGPSAETPAADTETGVSEEGEEDGLRKAADALDIRVGKVVRAWRHPEADSLYVEEVDVGEVEPRTICSGLVAYVPLEHLQDSRVVVLANLKPRNMRGIKSNGMLMAASDAAHENVELLVPPEGSMPGERIWFGSDEDKDKQQESATPNQVQKKKIWENIQPHLKTTDTCVAVLGEHPMRTSAGMVVCKSLKLANIS
ncbi:putative methionine--tRNA ligase [Acorus gramineus]|uniref:Methionine--tRNA ligase n=1 Tax=Acorus gramineus TaxID=55184 RepID=A0AAV9AHF9_ACOGR|nr:putative methionine--tRNA ligase [Acorus gramineus]